MTFMCNCDGDCKCPNSSPQEQSKVREKTEKGTEVGKSN
jgi:hypothetical protein